MAEKATYGPDPERTGALIALLEPARKTRVVEVGANPINENPYAALRDMGGCDVWGFEPDPRAFARLESKRGETYLPHAVGDGTRRTLHVTRMPSLTSLLEPEPRTTAYLKRASRPMTVEQRIEVETVALDGLESPDTFDLLKIDVQGGEGIVFDGAAHHLERVAAVITEVAFIPLYKDQPLLDEQMRRLRERGLMLHKFLHLKGLSLRGGIAGEALHKQRHGNQLVDGDAVFIRDLSDPDEVADETLKHLAILADSVLASFDLTLRCLDLLIGRGKLEKGAAEAYATRLPDRARQSA